MHEEGNYGLLLSKLDQFIRKYYVNQLIRGSLLFLAVNLLLYLAFSLLEYYLYLPPVFRQVLIGLFSVSLIGTLTIWVAKPAFSHLSLGKRISHEQAAVIIGRHFQNVEDRLLNILQLKQQATTAASKELIEASIDQKISQLKPVPFTAAINFRDNKRYLRYAMIPLAILVLILLLSPKLLRESNERLIYSSRTFEKPAPFQFLLEGEGPFQVIQSSDFNLDVAVAGDALPEDVVVVVGDYRYRMNKQGRDQFDYTFRKVQEPFSFYLLGSGYASRPYRVEVIPKPTVLSFEVSLDYPSYTRKQNEKKGNIGDLVIPAGTKVSWIFQARNTDKVHIRWTDSLSELSRSGEQRFQLNRTFLDKAGYTVLTSNRYLEFADSISYFISVIPDAYPAIQVEQFTDSNSRKLLYFLGEASDDYGLSRLAFRFRHSKGSQGDARETAFQTVPLRAVMGTKNTHYSYTWDLHQIDLKPGDKLEYYFAVWDNDQVNGSKMSRTAMFTYDMPTEEELRTLAQQSNDQMKSGLEQSLKEAQEVRKEIRSMQDKMLQQKEMSWQDKQNLEKLLDRQKDLHKNIERLQQEYKRNNEQKQEYRKDNERILEKEERLAELFDEMVDKEMQELMEKIQELMEKLNKEQMMQQLDEFELNNDQLEKELDRMLELFKKLEFEAKMQETIDQLEELAQKQEDLATETEEANDNADSKQDLEEKNKELSEEQQKLNEAFEELSKEMDKLQEMNEELGNKADMDGLQEDQESIKEDMEQGKQELDKNKNENAKQKQQDAAEKMKQTAQKMSGMMSGMQQEQVAIDMESTRQLLDNLIHLSHEQEELMLAIGPINVNTPRFKELGQQQHKIKEDMKLIEDSLVALSKRVFQISSVVNKELTDIKGHMEKTLQGVHDRNKREVTTRQQYMMTGMNNLALILDELLQALQEEMASMMSGAQMCQKPQSGESLDQLQKMQQELNKMLDEIGKKMDQGKQGEGSEGKEKGMSQQMAEMAAKQAAIRKAIQEINQELNKDGKNSLGELEELVQEMDKSEEDIVNKRLTEELMKRQKDIEIRLLEAANAQRERDQSPERESKTADEITRTLPPSLEEYLRQREAEIDLYRTVPPTLKPFYRKLVEDYFKAISIND